MTPRDSTVFAVTSKSVTGLAIVFLVLAAFFGFLNSQKVKALRTNTANAQVARDAAERRELDERLNEPADGTAGAEQQSKIAEAENRAAKAEAEPAQGSKKTARNREHPERNSHSASRRCPRHCACIQSGLQFRGAESRCS